MFILKKIISVLADKFSSLDKNYIKDKGASSNLVSYLKELDL